MQSPIYATTWSTIAESDPLERWKTEFAGWLEEFAKFRRFEQAIFFRNPDDANSGRQHRGFLCELISHGELLDLELSTIEAAASEKAEQAGFLQEFLINLRSTFTTWHSMISLEDVRELAA